jgi:hypothetical protein
MNLQELKVIQMIAGTTKERFRYVRGISFCSHASIVKLRRRTSRACDQSVFRGIRLFKTKQ